MRTPTLFGLVLSLCFAGCGGSSGTDAGGSDTGSGSDTPAAMLSCGAYCTAITAACTGANMQYASAMECMTMCAGFPVGTPSDTSGNTLGCRTYHAGAAVGDPATHCSHAGPSGGGVCM
jgi:hypothetical protein